MASDGLELQFQPNILLGEAAPENEKAVRRTEKVEDARAQPWKKIYDELTAPDKEKRLDGDFFDCNKGFHAQTLGA